MIFEKLADTITKHAKLVAIIWVLVLLASVYPAIHANESLSYSTTSMGGDNTESIAGMEVLGKYFQSSSSDSESQVILLVTYGTVDDSLVTALDTELTNIPASDSKVAIVSEMITIPGTTTVKIYTVTYISGLGNNDISNDTANLRDLVGKAVATATSGLGSNPFTTYVTGSPAISYDAGEAMTKDISRVDPLSILMILVLVGLFFRSFVSSAAPPITIGVAFALVMCALFFLGQVLEIYYITEVLLLVSMLGAGCDYCIFILARYREERRRGLEHIAACREAIMWAGESVATSGIAVMIGFGAMMICSFNLVSYMGLGLAIGIIFALLAALTLMSSLLVLLGDRLFWPTGAHGEKLNKGYIKKMGQIGESYFRKSTNFSIKHAKAIIVATILFTVPMVYVYATSENSYDMIGSMMTGESQEGMTAMSDLGMGGMMMANYAVFELSDTLATVDYTYGVGMLTWDDTYRGTVSSTTDSLMIDIRHDLSSNVSSVSINQLDQEFGSLSVGWSAFAFGLSAAGVPPGSDIIIALEAMKNMGLPAAADTIIDNAEDMFIQLKTNPLLPLDYTFDSPDMCKIMDWMLFVGMGALGGETIGTTQEITYVKMTMSTKQAAMADDSIDTVQEFKNMVHKAVDDNDCLTQVYVTGTAAVMVEISEMMGTEFLKIELTAIILIIILLFFVMKSYLTPLRSVITIFMSVIWTVAITHLLFNDVLNAPVLWLLPIILLVICLGLGMDYDILLTTRIREYRFAKGMSNDEAITNAVLHSGSVITICGLIMGGTFGTLMLSSTVMLQQMGFALCFAILVDALVVRTYIVPAAMHLMADWNWKGPAFLRKDKKSDDENQQ